MSIEPPNGILDIRKATLWVSKYLSPRGLSGEFEGYQATSTPSN